MNTLGIISGSSLAGLVIVAGVLVFLIYNLALKLGRFPGEGINDAMARVLSDNPLLCFLLGVIAGHLWWNG